LHAHQCQVGDPSIDVVNIWGQVTPDRAADTFGRAREDHGRTIDGRGRDWTAYEITARIPADADLIRFGITLTGEGRIALRNPGLRIAEPADGTP